MQPEASAVAPTKDPRAKLAAIEAGLNERFLEREEEVRGLLCALLAGENALLLGLKGAAKTQLASSLCHAIEGASYFQSLLSRYSTPEQILGPYSIKALENDSYSRKTDGYLPTADLAFIDEIFKANSAILNELLPVLEERQFFDDGRAKKIPLKMVIGASNELPHDRQELDALWDRFMVRLDVSYLSDDAFRKLISRGSGGASVAGATTGAGTVTGTANGAPPAAPGTSIEGLTLEKEELASLRDGVASMDTTALVEPLIEIRRRLTEARIPVSDRRYVKSLKIAAAQALLTGRTSATAEDLSILSNVLWTEPSHIREVRRVVMEVASPQLGTALDLMDEAQEVREQALSAAEEEKTAAGQEANAKLKRIQDRLLALRSEAAAAGHEVARIDGFTAAAQRMIKEVLEQCLGLSI